MDDNNQLPFSRNSIIEEVNTNNVEVSTTNYYQMNNKDNEVDKTSSICSICFEHWSSSGEHQLIVTKCGHLFGLKCIKDWLSLKQSRHLCPICKTRLTTHSNNFVKIKGVTEITIFDNKERNKMNNEIIELKRQFEVILLFFFFLFANEQIK